VRQLIGDLASSGGGLWQKGELTGARTSDSNVWRGGSKGRQNCRTSPLPQRASGLGQPLRSFLPWAWQS